MPAKSKYAETKRRYYRERYANDSEFRARRKAYASAYQKRRWKADVEFRVQKRLRYEEFKRAHPKLTARRARAAYLRYTHGDDTVYDKLFTKQRGRCLICRSTTGQRRLHIDHNHRTGAIRGLLCGECNRAIGLFKDSPLSLRRAIRYLSK